MVPIPDFDMETLRLCHRGSIRSNGKTTGAALWITDVGMEVKGLSQTRQAQQHR